MEEFNFYSDIDYNKSKRKHFYIFMILAFVFICGFGFSFIIIGGGTLYLGIALIVIFLLLLLTFPRALKNYPVVNKTILTIGDGYLEINGVKVNYKDIKVVRVTCFVPPVGDENDNLAYFEKCVKKPTEDRFTGSFDVYVLSKDGKKTVGYYSVIEDCKEALQVLSDTGFNKYKLAFSMKRMYKEAEYKLSKRPAKE